MTDDEFVYDVQVARGVGAVGNGSLQVIVLADTYVFDRTDSTVADVAAHEVAGVGYERASLTATVDLLDGVWRATPTSTPSIDCTDVTNRGGVLVARNGPTDADRSLVKWSPAPGGGEAAFEPFWPGGIVSDEVSSVSQDLASHAATTIAHGLPSLVEVPDGKVLSVIDEAWAFTDGGPGGGGGGGGDLPDPTGAAPGTLLITDVSSTGYMLAPATLDNVSVAIADVAALVDTSGATPGHVYTAPATPGDPATFQPAPGGGGGGVASVNGDPGPAVALDATDVGAASTTGGGKEQASIVPSATGSVTVDLGDGNAHDLTLTGNIILTLTGATVGVACSLTLVVRQGATGGRVVTWPSSVKWAGGTPPTLSTAASKVDAVGMFTVDGGTTWLAGLVGKGYS